ncbi:4Fe-4S dicluster domain-containing protein [Desulfosporosinus sp. Sb-LF]|uniref:4Fe-4S dicluster domain-containing protein n=1 Tax=Desulfosporosinus sp. Sb-LF TaxID=2560027 RepID=UPI00107F5DA1|nr:4Fe-4S dicluster domain-containing protein [Desulfosporosinus sp. Sb-LF]TGE31285.1 4Fe-4S dicluster domain-containing protein [Desulfosporosinus sp. Sb-LF]
MQQKGFEIEHCRPNCPKAARHWHDLSEELTLNLNELNLRQTLEKKFTPVHHHHLPKVCLAGCPNGCSHPNIKDFGISGYVFPRITDSPCSGCGACVRSCLERAITMKPNGIIIDNTRCLSCGDCQSICPSGTLTSGESGWTLRYGGRVGRHPKFGKSAGQVSTDQQVVAWIIDTMLRFIKEGHPQERLTHFLER